MNVLFQKTKHLGRNLSFSLQFDERTNALVRYCDYGYFSKFYYFIFFATNVKVINKYNDGGFDNAYTRSF